MAVSVYATLKQVLQDFIAPHLEALKAEISSVRGEISAFRTEMRTEIRRLDEKVGSVRNELKADIARIDEKLTFMPLR